MLATKKIPTHTDRSLCEAAGDIEIVDGALKITTLRVQHLLKASPEQGRGNLTR